MGGSPCESASRELKSAHFQFFLLLNVEPHGARFPTQRCQLSPWAAGLEGGTQHHRRFQMPVTLAIARGHDLQMRAALFLRVHKCSFNWLHNKTALAKLRDGTTIRMRKEHKRCQQPPEWSLKSVQIPCHQKVALNITEKHTSLCPARNYEGM